MQEVRDVWDCIVVSTAGNGRKLSDDVGLCDKDNTSKHYPASYPSVISVTSVGHSHERGYVNSEGKKTGWKDCHEYEIGETFSSHHHNEAVDICAPGYGIWSTFPMDYPNGAMFYSWGTSYAAPMVSATIGLVLSINPCLSAKEAAELVINHSDSTIYNIPENSPYIGKTR